MNNTVTQELVDDLFLRSDVKVMTVFDKCTVLFCKLPNGFVLVEHSACVDPANYDEALGVDICTKRIKDQIWKLEGYKLQCKLDKG